MVGKLVMAPGASENGAAAKSHGSILHLDKSELPFVEQIRQACITLSIRFETLMLRPEVFNNAVSEPLNMINGPRYEWTLKWLLNKLSANTSRDSPCLEPRSWRLLGELIFMISPARVAEIFSGAKFLDALHRTIAYIRKRVIVCPVLHFEDQAKSEVGDCKKSKKRKIDDTESKAHEPDEVSFELMSVLILNICETLHRVQCLIKSQWQASLAAEQLRKILRCATEEAANIVNNAVYLLEVICRYITPFSRLSPTLNELLRPWQPSAVETYLKTYMKFWDSHSLTKGDADHARSQAFTKSCLTPTLVLWHTIQSDLPTGGPNGYSIDILESLVVANTVKPIQKSYKTTVLDLFADLDEIVVERLDSSPVEDHPKMEAHRHASNSSFGQNTDNANLVSKIVGTFFDLAITYTSRGTPKSRKEGNSFLLKLFDQLRASLAVTSRKTRSQENHKAVKVLLEQAVKNEVQLSNSTIESILRQNSGLFDNDENRQVDWGAIGFCVRNNADIFLNPKFAISDQNPSPKVNEVLENLLTKLSTSTNTTPSSPTLDHTYSLKLDGVLIPLVHAFAKARDFPAFFGLWKTRFAALGNASIWTDDAFLSTLQEMIRSSLSVQEINSNLERIESFLAGLCSTTDKDNTVANLVILGCIVGGPPEEESRSRQSHRIWSIYSTLATSFLKLPKSYNGSRWRVWRILSSINQTWTGDDTESSTSDLHGHLIRKASQTVEAPGTKADTDDLHSFQEQSFAFSFLASLSSFSRSSQDSCLKFMSIFNRSLDTILDLKNLLCQKLEQDPLHISAPSDTRHNWDGRSVGIQSHHDLYISCIARLLLQSELFCDVEEKTQQRLLTQLSVLAHPGSNSNEYLSHGINYSSLWNHAQCCEAFYEQKPFARNMHYCQSKRFGRLFGPEYIAHWHNTAPESHVSILESLLDAPVSHFNTEDMISVADGILDQLMHWKDMPCAYICLRLQILVKFASVPKRISKSMQISQNIQVYGDVKQERSALFVLAEIVSEAASRDERSVCDDALCRLTNIILGHIYSRAKTDASAKYLKSFYQWIGTEMEHERTSTAIRSRHWTSKGPMLLVSMTALNYFQEHRDQAVDILGSSDLSVEAIRQKHFERVLGICLNVSFPAAIFADFTDLVPILQCLYGYRELFLAHPRMLYVHKELSALFNNSQDRWSSQEDEAQQRVDEARVLFYRISYRMHLYQNPDAMIGQLKPWRSQTSDRDIHRRELLYFQEYTSNLDCKTIKRLFPVMSLDYQRHLILGLTDIQKIASLQTWTSEIFVSFCERVRALCTKDCTETASLLSTTDPKLLSCFTNQYMFEDLLATISYVASRLERGYLSDDLAEIFTGLVHLFTTTVELHRPKFGARYHLILPIFQGLLRLLFVPYGTTSASSAQTESKLDASHASAYARLLSTWCDPSPSAVAPSRHRQQINLHDETKKAKEVAGQHLQYLAMTYCECRIDSAFAAKGMREALEPGLWALMGCFGDSIKRKINASLDPSGRAIWRKLYEDWKKFGEWQAGSTATAE